MSTPIKKKSGNKFESFLCCWCFSNKKSQGDSDIYFSDDNEPYEYILEKLAIKKVPISLFTLSKDIPKKQSENSEHSSSTPSLQLAPAVLDEKPSVSFSSYYKSQTSDHIDDQISQTSRDHKSISFNDEQDREVLCTILPLYSPRQSLTETQSKAIVADVLNKHSSLYTLGKDPIPKDPSRLPNTNRTVVPSSVRHAIRKQDRNFTSRLPVHEREIFHQRREPTTTRTISTPRSTEVYAEVHHIPTKKSNLKDSYFSSRQESIAPSIQNTIDSLKYTQKPHLPGIPPKNQRSMKASISDSTSEKEFYCVAPIHDIAQSNVFNRSVGTNSKMFTNQNVKNACDYEIYYNKLHRESTERDKYFPFHTQSARNTIVQQSSHWYPQERKFVEYENKKKVYTVPAEDEFHGPYHLRKSEYYNPKYIKYEDDEDDRKEKADREREKEKEREEKEREEKEREEKEREEKEREEKEREEKEREEKEREEMEREKMEREKMEREKKEKDNDRNRDLYRNRDREKDNRNYGQTTSRGEMVDDEQITDVRPKHGQNLKWKIIVKHHQDKNSDGEASKTVNKEATGRVSIPRRW